MNENEKLYGRHGALIIEGLQEAIKHARGEEAQVRVLPPVEMKVTTARKAYLELPPWYPPYRIREIRQKLAVSQAIFAQMLGVSASTVRAWEQGKRECEGPASRLLQIAEAHPEVLREVCGEIHPAVGRDRQRPRTVKAPPRPRGEERLAADTDAS